MDEELEKILNAGFTFADLSAEPDRPPEICGECATKGLRHESGAIAIWCEHTSMGAFRVPPRPWKLKGPIDGANFFAGVLLAPGMAAEKIRNGKPLQ